METLAFYKAVTMDKVDLAERIIAFLEKNSVRFCLIGGQAVNAYVEPLVSLDLDIAVAAEDLQRVSALLERDFPTSRFPHSLNIGEAGSGLRVQIQMDPRYGDFVGRSTRRDVLGMELPVAALEDVFQGKVWAASDPQRRASKRQKDLADIARLIEKYPSLREKTPVEILSRLE